MTPAERLAALEQVRDYLMDPDQKNVVWAMMQLNAVSDSLLAEARDQRVDVTVAYAAGAATGRQFGQEEARPGTCGTCAHFSSYPVPGSYPRQFWCDLLKISMVADDGCRKGYTPRDTP